MFRKLKTLLIAGFSTLALCAGTGLSYWIFTETSSRSIMSGAEVEDLYENYNAGKPVPIQQYEMYLFPSTWYLSQYNDSNNLPEEKYGYINRVLEDDGKTITDTYVIKNQAGVLETMSSVPEYSINSYCKDVDTYDAEGTTDYKTFKLPTNSEPQFDKSILNFNLKDGYKVPTGDKGFNDVGSFAKDLNDTTGVIPTQDNDGIFQETESTDHSGTAGKPIYQELNVDDRLGYWYELEANEGRYLPIKISFSGSISPEVFLKLVSNPRCDMGDANGWHNYAFANWFYYDPECTSGKAAHPARRSSDGSGQQRDRRLRKI